MARRLDHRGAARISQKRLTSWFEFFPANAALVAGGGTIFFSLNAAALALRPFTVVRSHFLMHIRSDQLGANEFQAVALGIAIVSDQASAIGVTAIPTPYTDMGSDLWFLHEQAMNHFTFVSGVGFDAAGGRETRIDSKAMRKVDIGQDLVVVAEIASGISTGVDVVIGGRMLVKVN